MREILYRAISMCRGEHWVYGQPRHYANPHTEKWTVYDPTTGIETDVDKETIGQYTGLKDWRGVPIFNGDILSGKSYKGCWKTIGHVVDGVRGYCYDVVSATDRHTLYSIIEDYRGNVEVIGNIHDNEKLF